MSYCVNCGVELEKSERVCPLCGTEVLNPKDPFDPTAAPPYARYRQTAAPRPSRKTVLELITLIFLIPITLSVVCNISISGGITWAGFAVGALLLLWLIVISPIVAAGLRRRSAPAFLILINLGAVLCYLYYIQSVCGGDWFASFAFPLVATLALMILFLFVIAVYSRLSGLFTLALSVMLTGIFCVVTESLLNLAFSLRERLTWSLYPMTTLVVLGLILIFIDCKPALKEKLRKKFFI